MIGRPLEHEDIGQHRTEHKPQGKPRNPPQPRPLEVETALAIGKCVLYKEQDKEQHIEGQEGQAQPALRPLKIYHSPLAEPIEAHSYHSIHTNRGAVKGHWVLLLESDDPFVDKW